MRKTLSRFFLSRRVGFCLDDDDVVVVFVGWPYTNVTTMSTIKWYVGMAYDEDVDNGNFCSKKNIG